MASIRLTALLVLVLVIPSIAQAICKEGFELDEFWQEVSKDFRWDQKLADAITVRQVSKGSDTDSGIIQVKIKGMTLPPGAKIVPRFQSGNIIFNGMEPLKESDLGFDPQDKSYNIEYQFRFYSDHPQTREFTINLLVIEGTEHFAVIEPQHRAKTGFSLRELPFTPEEIERRKRAAEELAQLTRISGAAQTAFETKFNLTMQRIWGNPAPLADMALLEHLEGVLKKYGRPNRHDHFPIYFGTSNVNGEISASLFQPPQRAGPMGMQRGISILPDVDEKSHRDIIRLYYTDRDVASLGDFKLSRIENADLVANRFEGDSLPSVIAEIQRDFNLSYSTPSQIHSKLSLTNPETTPKELQKSELVELGRSLYRIPPAFRKNHGAKYFGITHESLYSVLQKPGIGNRGQVFLKIGDIEFSNESVGASAYLPSLETLILNSRHLGIRLGDLPFEPLMESTIFEFGRAVWFNLSDTSKKTFSNMSKTQFAEDDFAQSFLSYVVFPEKLKSKSYKRYEYFVTLEKYFEDQDEKKRIEVQSAPPPRSDAIEESGQVLVEKLIENLRTGSSSSIRAASAKTLGELRAPGVTSHLIEALESDPSSDVRANSAIALGELRAKQATSYLIKALKSDPSSDVRIRSAGALRRLKSESAISQFIESLSSGDPGIFVRMQSAEALGELKSKKAIPYLVNSSVNDPSHFVRKQAALAAEAINAPELILDHIDSQKGSTNAGLPLVANYLEPLTLLKGIESKARKALPKQSAEEVRREALRQAKERKLPLLVMHLEAMITFDKSKNTVSPFERRMLFDILNSQTIFLEPEAQDFMLQFLKDQPILTKYLPQTKTFQRWRESGLQLLAKYFEFRVAALSSESVLHHIEPEEVDAVRGSVESLGWEKVSQALPKQARLPLLAEFSRLDPTSLKLDVLKEMKAVRDAPRSLKLPTEDEIIHMSYILEALSNVRPSMSVHELKRYQQFALQIAKDERFDTSKQLTAARIRSLEDLLGLSPQAQPDIRLQIKELQELLE